MPSTIKNICHGKRYKSRGEERMRWTQVGILIEKDGKQYIKLQYIPIGIDPDDGIFLNVFDQNHGRDGGGRGPSPEEDDHDDDIPF